MRKKNGTPKLSCNICDFSTTRPVNMRSHMRSEHKDIQYCHLCNYSTSTTVNLKNHMALEHRMPELLCDECEFSTTNNAKMKSHKKSVHQSVSANSTPNLFCNFCDYSTTLPDSMKSHTIFEHEDLQYKAGLVESIQVGTGKLFNRIRVRQLKLGQREKKT